MELTQNIIGTNNRTKCIYLSSKKSFDESNYFKCICMYDCYKMNILTKYISISMYSPKDTVDNISSTIAISTFILLITIPITVLFAIKYFNL